MSEDREEKLTFSIRDVLLAQAKGGVRREAMSEADLQAIRERCSKATPGPWDCTFADEPGFEAWIVGCDLTPDSEDVETPCGLCELDREADARFIAHARADIPKLLAEVERLRQAVQKAQRTLRTVGGKEGIKRCLQAGNDAPLDLVLADALGELFTSAVPDASVGVYERHLGPSK